MKKPKSVVEVGNRYERLTVVKKIGRKGNSVMWECECSCGNITQVAGPALTSGNTKSCGCLGDENRKRLAELRCKHGGSKTRLYTVWKQMKKRCTNPNERVYKYYGALGIKVCDEWKNSFPAFRDWMIEHGYDETAKRGKYTIDRIDPDGDYCPENCRVVDMYAQVHNRRKKKNNDIA